MEAVITLPDTILSSIKIRKSDLNQFLRRTLAVALYREGRLSLGKAAELAGVRNKWEMMILLDKKGVPLDYDAADAAADLKDASIISGTAERMKCVSFHTKNHES